jgi:hypothetical protein
VKGTLIRRMPSAFAGGRRNASLGRSVSSAGGSFPGRQTHRRQQVSSGTMRRGTSSACAKRTHSSRQAPKKRPTFSRTRPSLGPETRARQSTLNSNGASRGRCRGRFGIAVGQTLRKQGGTGTEVGTNGRMRGSPRVTAIRGNPSRSCVTRQKRKVDMATVPARKREPRSFRPYVVCSCRSRQAASWPRISSHAALQKEWR